VLEPRHLPESDRLSVLAATILLAYASARFVDLPAWDLGLQLPGIYLSLEINVRTVVALLVAGLTATGAEWLLREHPSLGNRSTLQHWLLPALTAWVIGVPLYRLPPGPQWLASFAIGGALLMLVLVAEYIVIDPQDVRHALATAGLTAVSFALFLMLAITLRSAGLRLFQILPVLTLFAGLVSLRTLHLRLQGQWVFFQAGALALIVAQLAASLHYWPISPVTYGLALLGPAYALTSLIGGLSEGEPLSQALFEPAIVLVVVWTTAVWTAWTA
jgi:hypothetical protein